jgi:hypothetical protein
MRAEEKSLRLHIHQVGADGFVRHAEFTGEGG